MICSGILDSRLAGVREALQAHGLEVLETEGREEWRCVVARREEDAL